MFLSFSVILGWTTPANPRIPLDSLVLSGFTLYLSILITTLFTNEDNEHTRNVHDDFLSQLNYSNHGFIWSFVAKFKSLQVVSQLLFKCFMWWGTHSEGNTTFFFVSQLCYNFHPMILILPLHWYCTDKILFVMTNL